MKKNHPWVSHIIGTSYFIQDFGKGIVQITQYLHEIVNSKHIESNFLLAQVYRNTDDISNVKKNTK